ncbi:MAG: hypothetical protein HQ477_11585 [Chloroflexi bacterium]|nr:hypothetical protein [Chloroflexota bacterium]
MASVKYSFTSSGQMRIEGKDEMRSRGERSPDLADAVMLAFAKSSRSGLQIWVGPEEEEIDSNDMEIED